MISVAFDARKYSDYGIGTYVRHLLGGFARRPSAPRITLFTARDVPGPDRLPQEWARTEVPFKPYGLGEYFLFGRLIRKSGCTLFHTPHYTTPAHPGIPTVVTVHDLIHLRFPDIFSAVQRAYARFMLNHAAKVAALILTPSEATKRDLVAIIGADPAKIKVTPLGVDRSFRPRTEQELASVRVRYSLPERYVLFLGNPKPHKGILKLLQAMSRIHARDKELYLVIAGGTEADAKILYDSARALGLGDTVTTVRNLPQPDISLVLGAARLLALPSEWEGFGLPVIEAMACGTPVVCSSAGSLTEVAGEAALMNDPADVETLASNIQSLAMDDVLHKKYSELGLKRSELFSWDRTVEQTLEAYRSVLS